MENELDWMLGTQRRNMEKSHTKTSHRKPKLRQTKNGWQIPVPGFVCEREGGKLKRAGLSVAVSEGVAMSLSVFFYHISESIVTQNPVGKCVVIYTN
jgi:hypothetical protein